MCRTRSKGRLDLTNWLIRRGRDLLKKRWSSTTHWVVVHEFSRSKAFEGDGDPVLDEPPPNASERLVRARRRDHESGCALRNQRS